MKVLRDTIAVLRSGKRAVLKCMLAVRRLFFSEFHQHLNQLYITDYCIWTQTARNKAFASLATEIEAVADALVKEDVDLHLDEFEALAREIVAGTIE